MRARPPIAAGLILAALLALPPAALAFADVKGPPCADLNAGDSSKAGYFQDLSSGEYLLFVQLELSRPACSNITYRFHVWNSDATAEILVLSDGVAGTDANTGAPVVVFEHNFGTTSPGDVLNTFATTSRGDRVLDRGPDADDPSPFIALALGTAPGGRGYG